MKYNIGKNNPNYKHGFRHTKLYAVWYNMKTRCFNKKVKQYKDYGGRGITICNEWLEFIPFRDWSLFNGYQEGLEIDREDNDGNYEPSNCRWVTNKENLRNKRTTINMQIANEIRILYNSGYYTRKELTEKYNISKQTISYIINNKQWKM